MQKLFKLFLYSTFNYFQNYLGQERGDKRQWSLSAHLAWAQQMHKLIFRKESQKMDGGFSAAINIKLQIVLSGMRECGGGGY